MELTDKFQDKHEWNKFIADNSSPASFLQSWDWGEFNQKILNSQIKRIALIDENELKMLGLVIEKKLPLNQSYWYCPRGLVWNKNYMDKEAQGYGLIMKKINKDLGGKIFLRNLPPVQKKEHLIGFLKRLKFKEPKILINSEEPEETILLDLDKAEEELLKNMHPKTRYNIKLAEKKGIRIRKMILETKDNDISIFYGLSAQTAKRNKINIYGKKYYTDLINFFTKKECAAQIKLYIAEYQNKPLSSIMVVYFGSTATYLHGASSNEHRDLMPNYLIQWQAILDAKKSGIKIYDFWGISQENQQWAGITKFKKGFGGEVFTFLGTWDYILNKKWYTIFRLLRIIKKIIYG
ncbi:MAG: peptidoglycan bridge formation glycyltransferase FemA/FemB family protein [Patescibacteria group bacterium]